MGRTAFYRLRQGVQREQGEKFELGRFHEAVLAQKAGVSPQAVVEAIQGGLAGSTVLEAKAPMMLNHNFRPGFRINLHIKDLLNALDTSHGIGAPLPLTAAVLEMMTALKAAGHDREDHSGLVQHYESLAQTSLLADRV